MRLGDLGLKAKITACNLIPFTITDRRVGGCGACAQPLAGKCYSGEFHVRCGLEE